MFRYFRVAVPAAASVMVAVEFAPSLRRHVECAPQLLAPELNPDELAWAHIKTRVAKAAVQTKQKLKANVERGVMHRLQKLPDIVAGFFGTPTCAYAKV